MTEKGPRLFPILLVNFIGTLGFSIVLPFLVILVTRLGGNALVYGLMGATYSAFQFVGAPILGRWSDRRGRRQILLLSQLGTLAAWGIFLLAIFLPSRTLMSIDSRLLGSFALTLPLVALFLARALDGLTGGNVSVANAYLADITDEQDMKKNFGKMSVAANLGFILGPALAGLLGATRYGETIPVLAALSISLVASLVIAFYLPESKPCLLKESPEELNVRKVFGQEQRDCFRLEDRERTGLKEIFRLENVPYLLFLNFLIFLGFNFFYVAFPVHAAQGLNWSITDIGIFFSFLGVTTVIAQGPVLSRIAGKCSDASLLIVGGIILSAGFATMIFGAKSFLYAGAALFSLGNGLMWPSFLALLSKAAGRDHQGAVQGFSGSIGSLASIVGGVGGGVLYGFLGGSTFLIPALVILTVVVLSIPLLRRRPSNT